MIKRLLSIWHQGTQHQLREGALMKRSSRARLGS